MSDEQDDIVDEATEGSSASQAETNETAEDSASLEEVSLQDQLDAAIAERDEAKDQVLRTYAELENTRRRARKDADDSRKYQALPLARDLMPAIDNLRRAIDAAAKATDENLAETVKELNVGVSMVLGQIESTFAQHEIHPIVSEGEPLDPNVHEVLQQVPLPDAQPGTVIQEVEKGYKIHDRVLRPAKVIVAMAAPTEGDAS